MNTKSLPFIGLLVLASVAFALQDGALLRRAHVADSTDTYKVESVVDQVIQLSALGMGDQAMNIKSSNTLTVKTGKVDSEGVAEVELVTTDMKVEADGLAAMMGDPAANLPKELRVPGTMDTRNRFVAAKGGATGMDAMMNAGLALSSTMQFLEFPEKRVAVGESWDVVIPKNPTTGDKESTLKAKLESERVEGGVAVWVVSLAGAMQVDMDMGELAKNNPDVTGGMDVGSMKVTGTMTVQAEALIDKANGRTVGLTSTIDSQQKTVMETMGMTIDAKGKTTTKMTLVK